MTTTPAPVANLSYPKGKIKPPFQTREQIERQIEREGVPEAERPALWECLFLTLPELDEVLDLVRRRERLPHAYPMFAFAAHTGARRGEIRRALVTDFDFDAKTVLIRERKKDHEKVETYRTVPMSPKLEAVMREWFATHPGGPHAVCTAAGTPITEHYATKLIVNALKNTRWAVIPGWHCFRHSFISNCAARGVDRRLIDQWVGHTTEAMRRRYRHLVPAVSQAALASVFGPAEDTAADGRWRLYRDMRAAMRFAQVEVHADGARSPLGVGRPYRTGGRRPGFGTSPSTTDRRSRPIWTRSWPIASTATRWGVAWPDAVSHHPVVVKLHLPLGGYEAVLLTGDAAAAFPTACQSARSAPTGVAPADQLATHAAWRLRQPSCPIPLRLLDKSDRYLTPDRVRPTRIPADGLIDPFNPWPDPRADHPCRRRT
jgi:hypothetical protein